MRKSVRVWLDPYEYYSLAEYILRCPWQFLTRGHGRHLAFIMPSGSSGNFTRVESVHMET
jgi:hypothetical protein